MGDFLIYGATGYTGQLAAEHAVSIGLRPVLAGRNADRLKPLAARLGLDHRVFALDDLAATRGGLRGMTAVLHAAGPFSKTSRPMADACLAVGVHYCDITGEIAVFEALAKRGADAKAAALMLLPGAGFDVVPSDCLAAHVAGRLPNATRLRLSIGGSMVPSRGTAKTMAESIGKRTLVRAGGQLIETQKTPRAMVDFGAGPRRTIGVSWGDVSTAWYSTHIPDIEVFFEATRGLDRAASMPLLVKRLLATGLAQRLINAQIETKLPPGPSAQQRAAGRAILIAEAWNTTGGYVTSRLETPDGYALTAMTGIEIVRRAANGDAVPGYQTPATAYGADFVLGFEGVSRSDL
jgi:short subunit dehydrogenase-like uncharacterized protein